MQHLLDRWCKSTQRFRVLISGIAPLPARLLFSCLCFLRLKVRIPWNPFKRNLRKRAEQCAARHIRSWVVLQFALPRVVLRIAVLNSRWIPYVLAIEPVRLRGIFWCTAWDSFSRGQNRFPGHSTCTKESGEIRDSRLGPATICWYVACGRWIAGARANRDKLCPVFNLVL